MAKKNAILTDQPRYMQIKEEIEAELAKADNKGKRLLSERDLCEIYGVSRPTIRHALKELTDEGVLQLRSRRGRFPNASTPDRTSSRTGLSMAVLTHFETVTMEPFVAPILAGIDSELGENGIAAIHLSVAGAKYLSHDFSNVSGIICASCPADLARLRTFCGAPVVSVNTRQVDADDVVTPDNIWSAKVAVRHLISLGHRRIACITGNIQHGSPDLNAPGRLEGYKKSLSEAGIEVVDSLIKHADWSTQSGYVAGLELLAQEASPTAIFASNDYMAIGAIRAVSECGQRVPDDISVIGFDNIEIGASLYPALTTMDAHLHEMGRIAVRLLLERLDNPELEKRHLQMKAGLLVRETTAPFVPRAI